MTRILVVLLLISIMAFAAWLGSSQRASAAPSERAVVIPVRLGDRIQVVDAPIGCQVVRMRELGRRITIDCRRAGRLAGTYGTLFTAREAALIQFKSRHTASRIVVATHNGSVRRCEAG